MLNFKSVNIFSTLISIGSLLGYSFFNMPIWPLFLLFCVWMFLTMAGSFFIGWNYHFKSLKAHTNIKKNQIAITFDDGPHPEFTPKALMLLKKHDAKATFFC